MFTFHGNRQLYSVMLLSINECVNVFRIPNICDKTGISKEPKEKKMKTK